MANIPLKTIKFPGLDDTYTVPQVDDTLSVTGAAADAKATGDAIDEIVEVSDTEPSSAYNQIWIKDSETEVEIPTKAELDAVSTEVDELNERLDSEGLSDDIKSALLACFANVAWINEHGQSYYDALEDALYSRPSEWDYEWSASSGVAPANFQSDNIIFDNNSMIADDPTFGIGYSDIDIEIEMAWDTVVATHTQSTQLIVSKQAHHGAKIFVNPNNSKLNIAYGSGGSVVTEPTDVDYTAYHVYRLVLNNGLFQFYVDGALVKTGTDYLSLNNREPFISDISKDYVGNPTKLGIKAIRYKRLTPATNEKRLKVFMHKGFDGSTGEIVDNTKRAITEPLPFANTAPITVKFVGPIVQGLQCAPKVVDSNGMVWIYNSSTDQYGVSFSKDMQTATGYISTDDIYTATKNENGAFVACPFPNTNGTIRFMFAGSDTSSDLSIIPAGSLFINDEEYILEEG